jgi:fructokinase
VPNPSDPIYGGLEAGGTKFVCAVGRAPDGVLEEARFATRGPEETLADALSFFRAAKTKYDLAAIGIATFGPAIVDPAAPDWGQIGQTPKPGWSGTDLAGVFARELSLPVGFDTDVNGAGLAEARWGAATGCSQSAYVTIGTGIGGGIIVDGKSLHGLQHPEIGHIRVARPQGEQAARGVCPFHDDCLEGLASGPAIKARWGAALGELPPDHPAWQVEADYLGQLCAELVLMVSPQRIVLGGGVMGNEALFAPIRAVARARLGGYVPALERAGAMAALIVPPALGTRAGIIGALALAMKQR